MKKIIIYSFIVLLIVAFSALYYVHRQYQDFLYQPVFGDLPVILDIKPGSSYTDFVYLVKSKGGEGSVFNWKLMSRLNDLGHTIKTGEYEISEPMVPRELINLIDRNQVKTYQFTLIEGHTWEQIKRALVGSPLKRDLPDLSDAELKAKLDISHGNLEGQFLPETYQYVKGDTDLQVLQRAHQSLQQALDEAWISRDPNIKLKSPYELLILASIIEKESAVDSERNIISGVFHRRLQKGMRLQTDPTVIYGVGSAYAGDITSAHLRTDTPYNTYTRFGLPPTPICMVSKASLVAAAHPNEGNELYFVANNQGGHTFSATYEQHQKAVQKYLSGL